MLGFIKDDTFAKIVKLYHEGQLDMLIRKIQDPNSFINKVWNPMFKSPYMKMPKNTMKMKHLLGVDWRRYSNVRPSEGKDEVNLYCAHIDNIFITWDELFRKYNGSEPYSIESITYFVFYMLFRCVIEGNKISFLIGDIIVPENPDEKELNYYRTVNIYFPM